MYHHQIDTFCCQKEEIEDAGKSMKNALHVLQYAKGTPRVQTEKKSQACSLSHYQVMLD